jgi:fatty acid desaturase
MSESSDSGGGIGFVGLLTIAFIVLKLTGFIHWTWFWVWSPIWISVAVWVLIIVCFIAITEIKDRRKRAAKRRSP